MKVLLTGALGTIGRAVLPHLTGAGHEVRGLDLPGRAFRRLRSRYPLEMVWGSITDEFVLRAALHGVDAVIHLAALIPPYSERHHERAREVNLEGTRLLVDAMRQMKAPPLLVFASSFTIYGPTPAGRPSRTTADAPVPTNHYTRHKAESETIIRNSGLSWKIARLALVMEPAGIAQLDPEMFEIPLSQPIELLHPADAGKAFAALLNHGQDRQVFHLGGGPGWQLSYREMLQGFLPLFGLKMPPDEAFRNPVSDDEWYPTSWLDTLQSQQVLNYQEHSWQGFLEEAQKANIWLRRVARPFRGVIGRNLLRYSRYHK